jgi:Na+/phosphate symporter
MNTKISPALGQLSKLAMDEVEQYARETREKARDESPNLEAHRRLNRAADEIHKLADQIKGMISACRAIQENCPRSLKKMQSLTMRQWDDLAKRLWDREKELRQKANVFLILQNN